MNHDDPYDPYDPQPPTGTPEPPNRAGDTRSVNPIYTNQRYRIALRVAVILLLVTLTISISVIIISRDDDAEREAAFDSTLTAVVDEMQQAAPDRADVIHTPQNIAPPVRQEYPFAAATGAPTYRAAESCSQQTLSGTIRDRDGTPTDTLSVAIWGDYLAPRYLLTGSLAGQEPGEWSLVLDQAINRRVFVQLSAAGRYLSAPVEVILAADDCERTHATVDFEQVAPVE